jgi:transposase
VASDALSVSGRAMIEALIGGQRDPGVLADLAKGVLRKKIPDLTMALAGRFGDHHALLARLHLDHIDHLNDIGDRAAQTIISEIGVDMTRFPTADHLASWAGLCPGNHESAGKPS